METCAVAIDPRWREARNILCIRLDYLGDVLMCTPAIRALRESLAQSRITLLTSGSGAAAAPHIPEIDAVFTYAAPWMKSSRPHGSGLDLAFVEKLRSRRFDAAVIFTTYSQSPLLPAFLCYLANIPLRLAHCRENPYQMLTHWVPETEPERQVRHEVRRQLDLVATVGCRTGDERLSFSVGRKDVTWVRERLLSKGMEPDRPWLLFHPGATAESRRYPTVLWQEVSRSLAVDHGYRIAFTGSGTEASLIEQIREDIADFTVSLAGELNLGQLGAAISLASVAVSNNTGPAHMAAALGTPIVSLYALTNPQHTPWQVGSRLLFSDVPCRFCYKSVCPEGHQHCLSKVEPEQVVKAVLELLRGGAQTDWQAQDALLEMMKTDSIRQAMFTQTSLDGKLERS